jgi:hypothetical protein
VAVCLNLAVAAAVAVAVEIGGFGSGGWWK